MNPATGRITGLIDFDDASWGDPALDFVALHAAMGVAFTDAMAAAYMLPVDSGFRGRVDFNGAREEPGLALERSYPGS